MPRIGQNPMKWTKDVHHPERVTVATIVHIPFLQGYWAQSLEVLKLCLQSLRKSTQQPFDLAVFDNGSCIEVQDYLVHLRRQKEIQYLVLSEHNIGKIGAWNFLFSAAPGEIIAYSDSDVLFLPGWLEASLRVLEAFPEAGMITAQPARRSLPRHCLTTLAEAEKDSSVSIQRGNLIPDKYILACGYGLGRSIEDYRKLIDGQEDVLLLKGSTSAFVSADHFQFLTTRTVLNTLLPFRVTAPVGAGDEYQMDEGVDAAGFWRLSLTEYLVHHIGNRLPAESGLEWLYKGGVMLEDTVHHKSPKKSKLPHNSYVRRILKRVNALTYKLLYRE